jgi:hypothetical protein
VVRAQPGDWAQDLVAGFDSGELRIMLTESDGTLGPSLVLEAPIPILGITAASLFDTGLDDLILLGEDALAVARATGQRDSPYTLADPVTLGGTLSSASVADLNQDGHADVVALDAESSTLHSLFGDGTGALTAGAPIALPDSAQAIALADLDYDGAPDLASVHNGNPSSVRIHLRKEGQFIPTADSYEVPGLPLGVFIRDVDGDCRHDVVVATRAAWLVLKNVSPR